MPSFSRTYGSLGLYESDSGTARARAVVKVLRPNSGPTRVFLLVKSYETNFTKDTSGGIQTNKQYFDIASLNADNAQHLAELLRNKTWSDLKWFVGFILMMDKSILVEIAMDRNCSVQQVFSRLPTPLSIRICALDLKWFSYIEQSL